MSEQAGGHGQGTPFVARYGLVRPLQGRYLAGVCAALGRATRTDPVLWRVALAVLLCFGGVGALLYLLLWLITPEEGDTASPVEAMFGQGRSNTSPVLVVVLLVIAAATFIFIAPRPLYILLLATVVLLTVVLVAQHRGAGAPAPPVPPAPPGPAAPSPPPAPGAAAPDAASPAPTSAVPATGWPAESTAAAAAPDPDATVPGAAAATAAPPGTPGPGTLPPGTPTPPAAGYREPFAPHGPFAGQVPPVPPPVPPSAPRERSPLGPITFFSLLLVLGLLGALDLGGVLDVPLAAYVAAGLAVCGAGLVVGAWIGRARSLIALGLVLALALPFAHAADTWDRPRHMGTEVTWAPTAADELDDTYELSFGTGLLDLRQVDFTDHEVSTYLRVSFGEIVVLLPPDVAVEVDARVRLGGADVLGESFGGLRTDRRVTTGDPEAGVVRLTASVSMASLEVRQ